MGRKKKHSELFHSAKEEVQALRENPAHGSMSRIAFQDMEFLLREELRPVRLQLELQKPELVQRDNGVDHTIVVFGSARIREGSVAQSVYEVAKKAHEAAPDNQEALAAYRLAERGIKNAYYYEQAREFAALISKECPIPSEQAYIVTGGGPGIMEAANRGSYEVGAKSLGLSIVLPKEEGLNAYVTPELSFEFHYFAIRKMHFLIRARALVAFPGGFGTLDELFEALTLMQTGKIERVPILLFGQEFWEKVLNLEALADMGMIHKDDLSLYRYVETAQEAWSWIQKFYEEAE